MSMIILSKDYKKVSLIGENTKKFILELFGENFCKAIENYENLIKK